MVQSEGVVLHTFSLYYTPSTCTAHLHPVLQVYRSLYYMHSDCTTCIQTVLHACNLCCTYSIQGEDENCGKTNLTSEVLFELDKTIDQDV